MAEEPVGAIFSTSTLESSALSHGAVLCLARLTSARSLTSPDVDVAAPQSEGSAADWASDSDVSSRLSEASLMQQVWAKVDESSAGVPPSSARRPAPKSSGPQAPRRRCSVSIRAALAVPITLSLLLLFTIKYLMMVHEYNNMKATIVEVDSETQEAHRNFSLRLLLEAGELNRAVVFARVQEQVFQYVVQLPDRAVKGLWNSMKTFNKFGPPPSGETQEYRMRLAYSMWSEIGSRNLRRLDLINRADALLVVFDNNSFSGVVGRYLSDNSTSGVWYEQGSNTSLAQWSLDPLTALPEQPAGEAMPRISATSQLFYTVQAHLAIDNPRGRARPAWSAIHDLSFKSSPAMISWTLPISYCGTYDCMEGVAAASVALSSINRWCTAAWVEMADKLSRPPFSTKVDPANSAIFVLNQASVLQSQVGTLVGQSLENTSAAIERVHLASLRPAVDSPRPIVGNTARALLKRHGTWGAWEAEDCSSPVAYCQTQDSSGALTTEILREYEPIDLPGRSCWEVATHQVQLDESTRWLVVLVMPLGAFGGDLAKIESEVRDLRTVHLEELERGLARISVFNLTNMLVTLVCSFLVGLFISVGVSHDLTSLRVQMQQLTTLDLHHDSREFAQLLACKRAVITDLRELQSAFARLARVVQAFGRFVPTPVVRNIVLGNEGANRLHVSRREVTIMFSDIKGFTSIAEELAPGDLLFVLTRYLTVMTEVVERYGGVVGEIIGDGMLAFWNTPDDVAHHATKACLAALEQQEVLKELNREFATEGLPELSIRIGLHTGRVLSGNLGTETKMKFGCLGDAVNLAGRLEELCKDYGVGILCSGATRLQLRGIACTELGRISVAGKAEPMPVCQVVGRAAGLPPGPPPPPRR